MASSPKRAQGPRGITLLSIVSIITLGFLLARKWSPTPEPPSVARRAVDDGTGAPWMTPANGSHLSRREDYTCAKGRPCSNGACCGATGVCGYGPTYCGTGCISNCNAHAECGQYAKTPGQKCPLNTCCSKHGFCGTTQDYCADGCQSNCVLSPKPPASPKGQALSRVIGYYESWSYRSTCNHKKPTDLPLNELTHLNYAFAFIEPKTYELVVMDSKTEEGIFKLATDAKQYNFELQVFISVGGWTFSDNGTVTQPLLSEIASTEANRQKFADNVVKFCNKWGFDGMDLDWEYPGAPDRGGKPEDTQNMNKLFKTLRQTFNSSPRRLGLTFTIPSSYWYLKWFDVPTLLKYADWTNLMSYDLHGTWDRNNPIGAIVQGHTNLTEIKLAAELLWRVGVKPQQVSLGYGFYGRSFELSNPSCSTPGCPFKGGAREGPCSKTSGILMYYEIEAILKQMPNLKPVWDKKAAVKYLVFDKTQWISYDDKDTFGQKIEWANSVGFGGALIWASDTDDDKFSAMSGLMGKQVAHIDVEEPIEANSISIAQTHNALSGKDCALEESGACWSQSDINNLHMRCKDGKSPIGWDKAGCKDGGKPICCSGDFYPRTCQWRGSGGDCNGQCHVGEQKIHGSSWGGGYTAESSTKKCSRGGKAFCCEAGDFKDLVSGCEWTQCGGSCGSGKTSMLVSHDGCTWGKKDKHYCCPTDTLLHDCTWRGSPTDCPVANCEKDEVNVSLDSQGDGFLGCAWGRKMAGCCKVNDPPPPEAVCDKTTCEMEPLLCTGTQDDYGVPDTPVKRDVHQLARRGGKRPFKWKTLGGKWMETSSRAYPDRDAYLRNLVSGLTGLSERYYTMRRRFCRQRRLEQQLIIRTPRPQLPNDTEVEHSLPVMLMSRFPAVASHGRQWAGGRPMHARSNPIPTGDRTTTRAIPEQFWTDYWDNAMGLPNAITIGSFSTRQPSQAMAEALGSTTNPSNFLMLVNVVNGAKGQTEGFKRHMSDSRLRRLINRSIGGDTSATSAMLESLQETLAIFTYLNDDDAVTRQDNTVTAVRNTLLEIENQLPIARGLANMWDEFYPHYMSSVSRYQREVMTNQTQAIRNAFTSSTSNQRATVLSTLTVIENNIPNMIYPFEDPTDDDDDE